MKGGGGERERCSDKEGADGGAKGVWKRRGSEGTEKGTGSGRRKRFWDKERVKIGVRSA